MSSSDSPTTFADYRRELDAQWNEFHTYVASLSEEQLTQPTDAAGWTAKDHVMHVAVFENVALALLERKSRREAADVPPEIWEQDDDDPKNAYIQQHYRDMPLDEVMQTLTQTHAALTRKLDTMTEADLQRPASYYMPQTTDERPLLVWMPWETYYHYRDHMTWIAALVANA